MSSNKMVGMRVCSTNGVTDVHVHEIILDRSSHFDRHIARSLCLRMIRRSYQMSVLSLSVEFTLKCDQRNIIWFHGSTGYQITPNMYAV